MSNGSAPFNSYKTLLTKYLKQIKPSRILEWGPGGSTKLMLAHSDANIISYEHNPKYYDVAKKKFGNKIDLRLAEEEEYYNPDVTGKFDIVFIDGHWRIECLEFAKTVLSDKGVVLLHDSGRSCYKKGTDLYKRIEEVDGTLCLKS